MLNCGLCDYYKESEGKSTKSLHICEFTGFVFGKNPEDYNMDEHPCFEVNFDESPVELKEFIA